MAKRTRKDDKVIWMRCSGPEHKEISDAAEREDRGISDFSRRTLLTAIRTKTNKPYMRGE